MAGAHIEINLFGACAVRSRDPQGFQITGAKHKALFALLATAPFGRRTRSFLQETLWGTACYDSGRQSLRRALSDIKQIMGEAYGELLTSTNAELTLDLNKVSYVGQPGSGLFLEGLDLREEGFSRWLRTIRANPSQIHALYSVAGHAPLRSVVPVVAVVPFRCVNGGADHAVLGDWLAEEISRSLSRTNLLTVISHLSSRQLAQAVVDVSAVRSTLRADFFVTGSLRLTGGDIVLDADFVDATSGHILWTRQFIQTQAGFLGAAEAGVAAIVKAIGRSIADEAVAHASGRRLNDIVDHRLLVAGVALMHRPRLPDFARSRELIEESLKRAPRCAEAHAWLGKWYILSVFNGWSNDPARDTQLATDYSARALDISPDDAFCLTIDGFAHNNLLRRLDIAEARYDRALDNNPNESLSWLLKGALKAFTDNAAEAIPSVDRARLLSPIDPFGYFYDSLSATAYLSGQNYARTLELAEASLAANERPVSALRAKISALHFLGRDAELRIAGAELLRRQPTLTVDSYLRNHPAADFEIGRNMARAMRAAGIP